MPSNVRVQEDPNRNVNVGGNVGGGVVGNHGYTSTPVQVGPNPSSGTGGAVQQPSTGGGWTPPSPTSTYGTSYAAPTYNSNNYNYLAEQQRLFDAAQQEKARIEDERNKQLRRDKDAEIAEDARNKQASRKRQKASLADAAGLGSADHSDYYEFPKDSAKMARVLKDRPIKAKDSDITYAWDSDTVPDTFSSEPFSFSVPPGNEGILSEINARDNARTDLLGRLVSIGNVKYGNEEEAAKLANARDDARSDLLGTLLGIGNAKYSKEEEAARLKQWDAERKEERDKNAQAALREFRDAQQRPQRELESKMKQYARLNAQRKIREMKRPMDVGTDQMWSLLEARKMRPELIEAQRLHEQEELDQEKEAQRIADSVPGISNQDTPWTIGSEISGVTGKNAQVRKIISDEKRRQSQIYDELKESEGSSKGNFKDQMDGKFLDPIDFMNSEDGESKFLSELRKMRNAMLQRFLNPASLRIESEYVETRKERVNGKTRTYGTLRYSDKVEEAIGAVQNLYNCSKYNVMQLVQLRGGIGIDRNGKIAKVDPNGFRLTDNQFIELCRDIIKAQVTKGNPFAEVRGKPGGSGVRDETGRYVVVAGTRCFPLGYIPNMLLQDLMADPKSPLHNRSVEEIQRDINDQWINKTYPALCANTGGDLMFQARAIENMMRCFLILDGRNPANWDIPDIIERQTLMALRAEEASVSDPQIAPVIKMRQVQDKDALSRFKHRSAKRNGIRNADGEIQAGWIKKNLRRLDAALLTVTNLRRAGRAAKTMIMVSGLLEGAMAELQMSAADLIHSSWFNMHHGDIAADYAVTDNLKTLSQKRETIEARSVAESLYRAGGLDMLKAFLSELGKDGKAKYKLNRQGFRQFMYDYGYTDKNPVITDKMREKFNIKPGQETGFLYGLQHVMDTVDDLMFGSSNLFKEREASQFVQMSMAEMGRAKVAGRESYTNAQVENWGITGGGENLVRFLLQTDAGLEAFMTQGITSLGRKSPLQNTMRALLGSAGVTNVAVREMFGMFIEYGVSKVTHFPGSNTLSYLSSAGIKGIGDLMAAGNGKLPLGGMPNFANAAQRNFSYQVGASYSQNNPSLIGQNNRIKFNEGLRKNLMYDMIMAGTEIGKAFIVMSVIQALGGLYPPPEDEDKYTFSEWKIGDPENGLPIKWAWWTDDLAGIGLPLGMSLLILQQYGWDSEDAKKVATNGFINMLANYNDNTSIFNAIDFVTNAPAYMEDFLGTNVNDRDPSFGEMSIAWTRQRFWDLLGDMTPAIIGEFIPWSRDYLFKGDTDAHTPFKYYDKDGNERDTNDYTELMKRLGARNNWLQAMWYDFTKSEDVSSYKYAEMPLDTRADPIALQIYNKFRLDMDDAPLDQDERTDWLNGKAIAVIDYIENHFDNVDQAVTQGLTMNYEQIRNCRRYCFDMIDEIEAGFQAKLSEGRVDNFYELKDDVQAQKQRYYDLVDEYFKDSTKIPTTIPTYVKQETDTERRYVDSEGNPMSYIDMLFGNAHAEDYRYGNIPSFLPFSSPRENETTGYNYERIPYYVRLDEDGNPISDTGTMFDLAGELGPVTMGKFAGSDLQELMWGGQGNNLYDDVKEQMNIPREGVPTVGERALRILESTIPEALRNMTDEEMFGTEEKDDKKSEDTSDNKNNHSNYGEGYGRSYYTGRSYNRSYGGGRGYYSYSGGRSSYTSSIYNPKIYSTAKQVYSSRASGMQTKQPYKATTTYLRPNFSTKGSREAYKRSDI